MNWTRRDTLMLIAVLVIAAGMRFARPGVVEFKHDEAYLSLLALDALAAREFPLLGMPSSVGVPNAPASVWLMMIPYASTNNPMIATGFVALLNTVGVGVLFVLARRLFSQEVAIVAALLYAVNPWAILYSRKIWAQDMHTPFLLLALWFGVLGFWDGRRVFQVLCLPVLLFALQMHYAAWILLPLYAVLLVTGRKHISWAALVVSVLLGVLVLLPFGVGAWQTWQENPTLFTDATTGDERSITLQIDALVYHAQLATGLGVDSEMTGASLSNSLMLVPTLFLGFFVVWGIISGLLGYGRSTLFVLLLPALSIVAFSISWTDVFVHYFITSIPALCVLAGIGLFGASTDLLQGTMGNPKQLAYSSVAIIGVIQIVLWFQLLSYANRNATAFGIPLHYRLDVREALMPHDDVLLISDGYRTLYDEDPAVWAVLLHGDACLRAISGDNFTVFPTADAITVITEPDSPPRPGYTAQEITTVPPYTLYQPQIVRESLSPTAPITFDSGVQVVGVSLQDNILRLEWAMPRSQPGVDLQYFAHFIDADGERIAQRDAEFLPGRWWCEGDTLMTQIDVNVPPETQSMRVGMYALTPSGGFVNANVVDSEGNPIATWGDVPLP